MTDASVRPDRQFVAVDRFDYLPRAWGTWASCGLGGDHVDVGISVPLSSAIMNSWHLSSQGRTSVAAVFPWTILAGPIGFWQVFGGAIVLAVIVLVRRGRRSS